jgi:hypothetical protein
VGVGVKVCVAKVEGPGVEPTGMGVDGAETECKVGERELEEGARVTVSKGEDEGGTETVKTGTWLLGELECGCARRVSGEREGMTGEVEDPPCVGVGDSRLGEEL